MVVIRKNSGETIICGIDQENVIKKALECFLDHRAVRNENNTAKQLLIHLRG